MTARRFNVRTIDAAVALALAIGGWGPAAAQPVTDVKGGADHPAVSRYAGAVMLGYESLAFGELLVPLGPAGLNTVGKAAASKSERLEGKLTRLVYLAPEKRTPLEVVRNYEQELAKGGFKAVYSCAGDACGPAGGLNLASLVDPQLKYGNAGAYDFGTLAFYGSLDGARYYVARRSSPQGEMTVLVFAGLRTLPMPPEIVNRTTVAVGIVERAAMDTGMVTVDASAMSAALEEGGRVAIYGIYFDTNKADLKPESAAALKEIATLLQREPALKLLVVGHTDSVGDYTANLVLSDKRAASVIQALTTTHGVAAARLRPAGAGMMSPVATNETEEGRAKNRRVELVRQ
jgi:outer membrane protein OmpA-like peptidoglycan-associated protein